MIATPAAPTIDPSQPRIALREHTRDVDAVDAAAEEVATSIGTAVVSEGKMFPQLTGGTHN